MPYRLVAYRERDFIREETPDFLAQGAKDLRIATREEASQVAHNLNRQLPGDIQCVAVECEPEPDVRRRLFDFVVFSAALMREKKMAPMVANVASQITSAAEETRWAEHHQGFSIIEGGSERRSRLAEHHRMNAAMHCSIAIDAVLMKGPTDLGAVTWEAFDKTVKDLGGKP